MSAETYLEALEAHVKSIFERHDPREKESLFMSTLSHLTAAVKDLLSHVSDRDKQIADLQSKLTDAQNAHAAGISEADAAGIIADIEAVTGPVADPEATSTGTVDPSTGQPIS